MNIHLYSTFFLVVMTFFILRPVIPFVDYVVNKEYIVKNLCVEREIPKSCCKGKCHLNKELSKNDSTSSEAANDQPKKPQKKQIIELLEIRIDGMEFFETITCLNLFFESGKEAAMVYAIFIPPECSSKIQKLYC